jgi:hypothetical protein
MIEINLLPYKEKKKFQNLTPKNSKIKNFALIAVFLLFGFSLFSFLKLGHIEKNFYNSLENINKKISSYNDIKEYARRINLLNEKISVIEKLKKEKKSPVEFCYIISDNFIHGKMRLKSFSLDNDIAQIKGISMESEIMTRFIQNLKKSGYFQSIDLKTFKLAEYNSFEIMCRIKI